MTFCAKHNFIFIHIPKNAGTSIIQHFKLKHGHFLPAQSRKLIDSRHDKRPKVIAVVRNPWDRLVSCYEYFRMDKSYWHSNDKSTRYGKHPLHDRVKKMNFVEFVDFVYQNRTTLGKLGTELRPQRYWISYQKSIMTTELVRYESLESDLSRVLKTQVQIPKLNPSRRRDYRTYYNQDLVKKVAEIYASDIALTGYKFSG